MRPRPARATALVIEPARPDGRQRAMAVARGRREVALERGRRVAVARMAGLRPRRPIGRPPSEAVDPRRRVDRATEADPPATLAHLDLAEVAGAELGNERREELLAQPVDGCVIRQALTRRAAVGPLVGPFVGPLGRLQGRVVGRVVPPRAPPLAVPLRHRSDVLAGRRLVGPARQLPEGPSAGSEEYPQALAEPGPLGCRRRGLADDPV